MTSPMYSSGVVTSTDMIGSRSTGLALRRASLKAIDAGDLERHLRGVDVVVLAVGEDGPHVDGRVAGEHARVERLLDAGVDRGDVLLRDAAAGDLVDELVAAAGAGGLEVDRDLGVLARAAGLLLVRVRVLDDGLGDRLAVGHLRLADGGVDLELAEHAVDDHLEVQLAHAGDDGLAGVLVGADLEGRVLLGQAEEGLAHLVLVDLGLRLDGDVDHGLGELEVLEHDLVRRARRASRRCGCS